jgi:hypothetical protein
MTKLGEPHDPEGLRSSVSRVPVSSLPEPDLSGGVQLADRAGVFAHSFKCHRCTLHFVLFSWLATRHRPDTIVCPECRATGPFMHRITQLSESRTFKFEISDRDPEIYDVWPFRMPVRRP